jgi:hypothetical protein
VECPPSRGVAALNASAAFALRAYPAAHLWATHDVSALGEAFSQATSEGFELLFAYISGANARNESIAMTAPVWTAIGPGAGPFCSSTFRVGFSVPASLQAAAPEPSDARVSLTPTGEAFSCVAVRGFGGYANDTSVVAQAAALAAQLASGGWVFDAQSYAVAQYDSPFTAIGRHNEVLIPVAKEACAKAQAQARAQAEQR